MRDAETSIQTFETQLVKLLEINNGIPLYFRPICLEGNVQNLGAEISSKKEEERDKVIC